MAEPDLVARGVAAMHRTVSVPVTVKCRLGIDDQDVESGLTRFVDRVAGAGCQTFVVHARKAWLQGLSPKENRDVPPLDYPRVYRLKAARPDLEIVVNGGITTLDDAARHLGHVDGVMLGRAAYQRPYMLACIDGRFFGDANAALSRGDVLRLLTPYIDRHVRGGGRLNAVARHIHGLYHGAPRGRTFRRHLSENALRDGAGPEVIEAALALAEKGAHQAAEAGWRAPFIAAS